MNTTPITIEDGKVLIHSAANGIWLTQHQLANIFDVFVSAINSNIRAILKSEVLREEEVCRNQETENGALITLYNMEMITALAFRLKSRPAEWFRQWIVHKTADYKLIILKTSTMDTLLN